VTRRTKAAIAVGLSCAVLLIYAVLGAVAIAAYNTAQYVSVSSEALLNVSDLPPGFEADPDESEHLGILSYTIRDFWLIDADWDRGPYRITQHVVQTWIPDTKSADGYLELKLNAAELQSGGSLRVERIEGPDLGPGAAWRRLVDADDEDPVDEVVFAVNRGNWYSILWVKGYRDELSVEQVAAIARPMVARLDVIASR
jgi:hypothetical protein